MPGLRNRIVLLSVTAAGAIGGCGDSGDTPATKQAAPPPTSGAATPKPSRPAAAQIRRVVDQSNSTFAKGQYARTCSFYTASMQRRTADMFGAATCEQAQASVATQLRASVSPEQFRALTTYGIESVATDGNSARARYGRRPTVLDGIPGLKTRASLRMKRIDGRWLIASLPY